MWWILGTYVLTQCPCDRGTFPFPVIYECRLSLLRELDFVSLPDPERLHLFSVRCNNSCGPIPVPCGGIYSKTLTDRGGVTTEHRLTTQMQAVINSSLGLAADILMQEEFVSGLTMETEVTETVQVPCGGGHIPPGINLRLNIYKYYRAPIIIRMPLQYRWWWQRPMWDRDLGVKYRVEGGGVWHPGVICFQTVYAVIMARDETEYECEVENLPPNPCPPEPHPQE